MSSEYTSNTVCEDCAPTLPAIPPSDAAFASIESAGLDDPRVKPTAYDPLNPATFVAPKTLGAPGVVIEFCDRCRWLHRATWTSTELFLTFPPPALLNITLVPLNADETAGRFRVWLAHKGPHGSEEMAMVWDRKVEGRFPEMKELKQRIRDWIMPTKSLGHSDR